MKAKFIGIPGQPEIVRLTMYGQLFFKDEWTDVPAGLATKKLENHPHFESKFDKSEIAEDAQIKGEFDKLVSAQVEHIQEAKEAGQEASEAQAKVNAAADEVADEHKADAAIDSATEYQLAESAPAPIAARLTDTPESAAGYQAREEAGQVPAEIEPEEPRRGPGRPRKS